MEATEAKEKVGPKVYTGETEQAEIPFLTADKWQPGRKVSGTIAEIENSRDFGDSYTLEVDGAVEVDGKPTSVVKIGSLGGLDLAIKAAKEKGGMPDLCTGALVTFECTGIKKSKNANVAARPNFKISAIFPESAF